jgi:hypothetical protein
MILTLNTIICELGGWMGFFKRFRRPKAQLLLSVSKNELALGDELRGVLKVTSQEILDVEEISVSLNCVETMTKTRRYQDTVQVGVDDKTVYPIEEKVWKEEEYEDTETLYSDHTKVSGQMQVNVGFDESYPFVMKLPSIGRKTYHSINNNVMWIVNARMKIKGRRNLFSNNQEILVGKPSESVKEVVREVVLIPCAYCGGLMPQTFLFCPNCGARRK